MNAKRVQLFRRIVSTTRHTAFIGGVFLAGQAVQPDRAIWAQSAGNDVRSPSNPATSTNPSENIDLQNAPPLPTPEGMEVITRGPVHEAFAEPMPEPESEGQSASELSLAEPPPEPIREAAPDIDLQATGRTAQWVPGYWAIEEATSDWCWVSGTYRYAPPGRTWVSGQWANANGRSQWVSGYWVPENTEVQYLPAPPPSRTTGPNTGAPSPQHIWIPGQWVFQNGNYAWQNGYYTQGYENWVWTPACYVRTPRGHVHVPGYWDYRLEDRGMLFAPVRVAASYNRTRTYRPFVPLNIGAALVNLFVRPNYGHYYFGNYYGNQYDRLGYQPWAAYRTGRAFQYDPLATYYRTFQPNYLGRLGTYRSNLYQYPSLRPNVLAGANKRDLLRNGLVLAGTVAVIDAIADNDNGRRRNRLDDATQRRFAFTEENLRQQQLELDDYRNQLEQLSANLENNPMQNFQEQVSQRLEQTMNQTFDSSLGVNTNAEGDLPTRGRISAAKPPVSGSEDAGTMAEPNAEPNADVNSNVAGDANGETNANLDANADGNVNAAGDVSVGGGVNVNGDRNPGMGSGNLPTNNLPTNNLPASGSSNLPEPTPNPAGQEGGSESRPSLSDTLAPTAGDRGSRDAGRLTPGSLTPGSMGGEDGRSLLPQSDRRAGGRSALDGVGAGSGNPAASAGRGGPSPAAPAAPAPPSRAASAAEAASGSVGGAVEKAAGALGSD